MTVLVRERETGIFVRYPIITGFIIKVLSFGFNIHTFCVTYLNRHFYVYIKKRLS